MIDTANLEVREFDPTDRSIIGMGRPIDPKAVDVLAESIETRGQVTLALTAAVPPAWHDLTAAERDPTLASYMIDPTQFGPHVRFVVILGNHRLAATRAINKSFKTALLPIMPSALEALRAQLAENLKRQSLKPFDRASYIDQFIKAMPKGSTIEQIAASMGINPTTLQLHLAPKRIPERLRSDCDGLGAVIICLIGKIQKVEHMERVIQLARTGATKVQVEKLIKQLAKTQGRKPKWLEWKVNGRTIRVEVKPGEKGADVIADLEAAIKALRKYSDGDATGLGFVLA